MQVLLRYKFPESAPHNSLLDYLKRLITNDEGV